MVKARANRHAGRTAVGQRLVSWSCLALGAASLAAACSVDEPTIGLIGEGGSSTSGRTSTPGKSGDDSGGKNGGGAKNDGGSGGRGSGDGGQPPSGGGVPGGAGRGEAGAGVSAGAGGSDQGPPVLQPTSVCVGKTHALTSMEAYVENFQYTYGLSAWYSFSDTIPPNMPAFARIAGGAAATSHSGHVKHVGIKTTAQDGYGAGVGYSFINLTADTCVDVSYFDGLSFWLKGPSGDKQVTFQVVTPETQPVDSGGDCLDNCNDHPKVTLTTNGSWIHHAVHFDALLPSGSPTDRLLGFNFITADPSWEIWIDEVSFFEGTPPAGPVEEWGAGGGG